ncbi:MAG: response regulator [Burkholderiales bacterium]|nr:response regulator [Burkholderiales bacterium]
MVVERSPEELEAQMLVTRTKMLFGHVPISTVTGAGLALMVVALANSLGPDGITAKTIDWLALTLVVSIIRTGHALAYSRSKQCAATHWRRGLLALTVAFSACWGATFWMLPLEGHLDYAIVMIGSVIGISAAGVAMLNADRVAVRAWVVPALLSCLAYCTHIGGPYGMYGMVTVASLLIILLVESNRTDLRIGELLRLRYQSEQLAVARAQALVEAEQLSAAKGRFLATMSHEMRTPLHGILGLSRMLRHDLIRKQSHQHMDLLQSAGQHLLGVINDVMDFSRLQEGKLSLRPRPVDLVELAQDVCHLVNVNAAEKGLSVALKVDWPGNHWVELDADRFRQVLFNLLGNAVKFTDRGHIIMHLRAIAGPAGDISHVRFEIEDTGIGIASHELARVFDPFHQATGGQEHRAPGSGLGLSIAQQICKTMHGEISCESTPGVGSTFRVTLPITLVAPDRGGQHSAAAVAEQARPLSGTVLLVDDDPVNVLVGQAELKQMGMAVITAVDGLQALERLDEHDVDLILMDCNMPRMNGFDAAKKIRTLEAEHGAPAVPIVALTASHDVETHRQCLLSGMNDSLTKPFKPDELRGVLKRYLPQTESMARSTGPTVSIA